MSTRRERKEAKIDRRREWSGKAAAKSTAALHRSYEIGKDIPFGQPILVGHHSEGRARRDVDRIDSAMRTSVAAAAKAEHHADVADGIERQLATTIFSDDSDAIEALEAKVAALTAQRDEHKAVNKAYRKGGVDGVVALGHDRKRVEGWLRTAALTADKVPFPSYELTNLGAKIRTATKRIAEVKALRAKQAAATDAGGTLVEIRGANASVTFSEPPGRDVVDSLKGAGFRWSAPSWYGPVVDLPESIKAQCR